MEFKSFATFSKNIHEPFETVWFCFICETSKLNEPTIGILRILKTLKQVALKVEVLQSL